MSSWVKPHRRTRAAGAAVRVYGLACRRVRCQNAATHERHEPFRTALSLLLLRLAGRVVYLSVSFT